MNFVILRMFYIRCIIEKRQPA